MSVGGGLRCLLSLISCLLTQLGESRLEANVPSGPPFGPLLSPRTLEIQAVLVLHGSQVRNKA
jgi:hypothetical protein